MSKMKYFNIIHVCGIIECLSYVIIATRFTTDEEIQSEIDYLHKHVNNICKDTDSSEIYALNNGYYNYFTFEETSITPFGQYNEKFLASSSEFNINKQAVKNLIIYSFDNIYFSYTKNSYAQKKTFKEYLFSSGHDYDTFLNDNFTFENLISLLKDCYKDGLIKTDVENINF